MKRINLVKKLIKKSLEESLARIDPTGKIKLSEFSVVPPSDLIIQGLLGGLHLVGFAIGDGPELIMALDFNNSSAAVLSHILKLKKNEILEVCDVKELMESLFKEVGNIIAGQFAGRLSNFLGEGLLPSVPFLISSATQFERVLYCLGDGMRLPVFAGVIEGETGDRIEVYIIPSPDFIKEIENNPSLIRELSDENSPFRRGEHGH